MKNKIQEMFEGHEQGEQDILFEKYLDTLSRASFQAYPGEPIATPHYQEELLKYSRQLANNNMIHYKNENGKFVDRHLTRDEYDRVYNIRLSNGCGPILPYDKVKAFDNKFDICDIKGEFYWPEDVVMEY